MKGLHQIKITITITIYIYSTINGNFLINIDNLIHIISYINKIIKRVSNKINNNILFTITRCLVLPKINNYIL